MGFNSGFKGLNQKVPKYFSKTPNTEFHKNMFSFSLVITLLHGSTDQQVPFIKSAYFPIFFCNLVKKDKLILGH